MRFALVLALGLAGHALAQRSPPVIPPPPGHVVDPRPTSSELPKPQPPIELSEPPRLVEPVELPVPVGKQQCMKESKVPCRDDAKRDCKIVEIVDCG
jgi:hypothetical protein